MILDKNKLITHEQINDLVLFKWEDGLEGYIPLKTLRQKCPCANCEGEKDVFGNIYKGEFKPISNCLLYTSPSPRDQRGSRMPSSA